MLWEAASRNMSSSTKIPYAPDRDFPHVFTCEYSIPGRQQPARVAMRMRMRPIGMDVLNSLVESGDLDPKVISQMPTFTLYNTVTGWKKEDGGALEQRELVIEPMPITCP
jgi:hypothetical protein